MPQSPTVWQLNDEYANKAQFEKFAAKYPREFASLFANLAKIIGLLRSGNKMGGFQVGFFRSEGVGVHRVGQTGVPSAKESRLYVYPEPAGLKMFILGVGTKDTQQTDIALAQVTVVRIRQTEEKL
jgi:hypothetical protein